jgi:hypothetical protein
MGEIKISVSDQLEKLIEDISSELGIKKTEFIKSLVINHLRDFIKEKRR